MINEWPHVVHKIGIALWCMHTLPGGPRWIPWRRLLAKLQGMCDECNPIIAATQKAVFERHCAITSGRPE